MELTKRKVGGVTNENDMMDPMVGRTKQHQAANLAGSLKSDKPNLKLEELDLLFRDPTFQQHAGKNTTPPPPPRLSTILFPPGQDAQPCSAFRPLEPHSHHHGCLSAVLQGGGRLLHVLPTSMAALCKRSYAHVYDGGLTWH